MYTVKNTKHQVIATYETIETARKAIENTSNYIHYSPEACKELEQEQKPKHEGKTMSTFIKLQESTSIVRASMEHDYQLASYYADCQDYAEKVDAGLITFDEAVEYIRKYN